MKETKLYYVFLFMVSALMLASCSETEEEETEFVNWQSTNETYFDNLYSATQSKIAGGDTSWKIIRNWTLESNVATHSYDHIIAHVEKESNLTVSPLYSDSVRVHYSGHLIPSTSYSSGYEFDKSYSGTFDPQTSMPAQFAVSAVVEGFTTALLNMHLGDRWEVYIPYQLGYGEDDNSSIPGYSTLIFEIEMVAIYRPDADIPDWSAKLNKWIYDDEE